MDMWFNWLQDRSANQKQF
eukprot:CCRYP_005644-RC/>CCRYP_005644-RC protein AED:0.49 eAED:0.49 QI:0/-1/0/1/-1/0/1/0/18